MIDLIKESPFYLEIQKEAAENLGLRLLVQKFGEVDEEVKAMINCLSKEQIEQFSLAILDFNSIEDVRNWFQNTDAEPEE